MNYLVRRIAGAVIVGGLFRLFRHANPVIRVIAFSAAVTAILLVVSGRASAGTLTIAENAALAAGSNTAYSVDGSAINGKENVTVAVRFSNGTAAGDITWALCSRATCSEIIPPRVTFPCAVLFGAGVMCSAQYNLRGLGAVNLFVTNNAGSSRNFYAQAHYETSEVRTVHVDNFPAVQEVSGSVSVSNFPTSFNVGNWPSTWTVSGTVDIGNWEDAPEGGGGGPGPGDPTEGVPSTGISGCPDAPPDADNVSLTDSGIETRRLRIDTAAFCSALTSRIDAVSTVKLDPASYNTVALREEDASRFDLMWIGLWLLAGVTFGLFAGRLIWGEVRQWFSM